MFDILGRNLRSLDTEGRETINMSGFKDQHKFSTMCRLCMDKNVLLLNLNGKVKHSPSNILDVIEKFTTVKVRDRRLDSEQKLKNLHFL